MKKPVNEVEEYIQAIPQERKHAFTELRKIMKKNLPKGFTEVMNYGMVGYVVPHDIYPNGYHCNPKLPLPFISIASQKNFIALYHMGLYLDKDLFEWFQDKYKKESGTKPDMGKSCIRFKKPDEIPLKLIAELAKKISVKAWINAYEEQISKTNRKKN